jgi:hypothetical protein
MEDDAEEEQVWGDMDKPFEGFKIASVSVDKASKVEAYTPEMGKGDD